MLIPKSYAQCYQRLKAKQRYIKTVSFLSFFKSARMRIRCGVPTERTPLQACYFGSFAYPCLHRRKALVPHFVCHKQTLHARFTGSFVQFFATLLRWVHLLMFLWWEFWKELQHQPSGPGKFQKKWSRAGGGGGSATWCRQQKGELPRSESNLTFTF